MTCKRKAVILETLSFAQNCLAESHALPPHAVGCLIHCCLYSVSANMTHVVGVTSESNCLCRSSVPGRGEKQRRRKSMETVQSARSQLHESQARAGMASKVSGRTN